MTLRTRTEPFRRGLAASVILALVVTGMQLVGPSVQPAGAAAPSCASANIGVTALQAPDPGPGIERVFYLDNGSNPKLLGQYAGYRVTNSTGAPLQDVWVKLDSFTGGTVGLAPSEDGRSQAGPLSAGASSVEYFYLSATAATLTDQTHAVHVFNGRPGLPGSTELCQTSYTYDRVEDVIQALANKVTVIVAGPNPPGLGGIVTIEVQGKTGTLGSAPSYDPGVFAITPAALDSWPANAYELIQTKLSIAPNDTSPVTDYFDDLHFNGFSGANRGYTVLYTLRVTGVTSTPTSVYPIQNIGSGTQVKHTGLTGLGDPALYPPIQPATNDTTVSKSVSPSSTGPSGGRVTYTVVASNAGTLNVSLDDFFDTLPAGATYVPGSTLLDGVARTDPAVVGSDLTWVGPYDVAPGSTRTLVYQVDIDGDRGPQTNRAVARIAGTQIDTTKSTLDDAPATAVVNVANDVPDAVDDSASTAYQSATTIPVLVNDTDGDGDALTVAVGATSTKGGTLSVSAAGVVTYTPPAGFAGSDTFTYTVDDGHGGTDSATVTVNVGLPGAPAAGADAYTTPYGTELTVAAPGVLSNDSGTGIGVTSTGSPAHGSVTIGSNGALSYTPNSGWAGDDTFSYTVTDAFGRTATAAVTVTTSRPPAPNATNDNPSTPYATPLVLAGPGVLGNDSGTGITVTGTGTPAHGSVTILADGSLSYTPAVGWAGDDAFTYTITDAFGRTSTGTITVTTQRPPAPTASDDAYATPYGTDLKVAAPGVVANDSGTGLTVTDPGAPAHGSVTIDADGTLDYSPDTGWAGDDTFTYEVTDAFGRTSTASVTVSTALPGAPAGAPDSYTTPYGTQLVVGGTGLLGNDAGTGVSLTGAGPAAHGTVTAQPDGSFTYAPDAGWAGDDSFEYTITDAFGRTSTSTATVTTNLPAKPGASDDSYATPYGTDLTVGAPGVLGNDTGTGIDVLESEPAAHGTVSVLSDGSLTYTPEAGWAGDDTFGYTVTDAFGRTSTASITITTALPGAPAAADDALSTPYGEKLTVAGPGVLANDAGTGISVTANGVPQHGTVTVDPDGALSYLPDAGWAGDDSFSYTVTDAFGRTSTGTVTVSTALPGAPAAADDAYSTPYGAPLAVAGPGVLGNDTGTAIAVTGTDAPAHGTVTIDADGTVSYSPDAGWAGDDSFSYTVTDAFGRTSTASVTVTTDLPAAPAAADDAYATPYGDDLTVAAPGVLGNDSGTGIEVTGNDPAAHGTVTVAPDGGLTYTPDSGWAGDDSFPYTVTDAFGRTSTARITVSTALPGAPVAKTDAYSTPYGTDLSVAAPGVLGNDVGTGTTVTAAGPAGHGTVAVDPDGTVSYTPDAGWAGDDAFDYTITDAFGRTSTTAVTITTDLPTAPTAVGDTVSTPYATVVNLAAPGVLGNDDGTGITVTAAGSPGHGSVAIDADGSLTYTPDAGWAGDDTFTYEITDAFGRTASASVTVTTALPAAPIADDDSLTTPYNTDLTVAAPGVLVNDSGTSLTVTDTSTPGHGTVTVGANGSVAYTPDTDYAGADSFTYEVTDLFGRTASAKVTIEITTDLVALPVAADDTYATPYGTDLSVAAPGVLGNDTGVNIEVTVNGAAAHGTVSVAADGSFDYSPEAGWAGADTFSYTVQDRFSRTASASVTVTTSLPGAPVALDDAYSTPYGVALSLAAPGVLGNDTGTGVSVTAAGTAAHGTITIDPDGTVSYTPDAGWAGDDAVEYTITDAFGRTSTSTVIVTTDRPPAPRADDDSYVTTYETTLLVPAVGVLDNDTGTGTTVTEHDPAVHGTVAVASDGSLTYTPDAGWAGDDSFGYTITDAFGRTASAVVTITTAKPADPVANDDAYSTPYQAALSISVPGVLANDSGVAVTVTASGDAGHGTAAVASDGSLTYTPDTGWAGDDTFTYTITDSFGATATGSITVTTALPGAPSATADGFVTPYQTVLDVAAPAVLENDAGTGLTITSNTDPSHGTVALGSDGALTYAPQGGWVGADSFDYTITDAFGRTSTTTVVISTQLPAVPAAGADAYAVAYGSELTVAAPGVMGNDSGVGIEVTDVDRAQHGTITIEPDGSLTYAAGAGWAGDDTFSYTITDAFGRTATASITVTTSLPGAPVAVADAFTTPYGTDLTVAAPGVLGNDSGTGTSVSANGSTAHGSVAADVDGSFTYSPDAGWAGDDAFPYTIIDAFGRTSTTTATVTTELPPLPSAADDALSTPYGVPLTAPGSAIVGNDTGTGLTVTGYDPAAHGSLTIDPDGSLTYSPDAGWAGDDEFTYTVSDAFGRVSTAVVTFTTDRPAAPVAVDDAYSTSFESVLSVASPGPRANDTGTGITVSGVTTPAHGSASIDPDGTLTYTPDAAFVGDDSFDYTITDAFGRTSTATITVNVNVDLIAAPTASDDIYSTPYGTDLAVSAPGVLANDSGSGLTVTANGAGTHGVMTVDPDGTLTYSPDAGWAGDDTITYTISDQFARTATASITVTTALPGAPAAAADAYSTPYGTDLTVNAPGVLGNDAGTGVSVTGAGTAAHGVLAVAADGTLTYSPDAGWAGDDSASYTVTDAFGRTSTTQVTVTTDLPAKPVAADDAYATSYGTPLAVTVPGTLGNDAGTAIAVTTHDAGAHGTATVAADGSLTYEPDTGWAGDDTFGYTITDAFGRTSTGTITVTTAKPGQPVAADDSYATPYGTQLTVAAPGVAGNDAGTGITVTSTGTPAHGTATIDPDATLAYTPDAQWAGDDTFGYTITDAFGRTSTATVTVSTDRPPAPAAADDAYTTPYGADLTVADPGILVNDTGTGTTVTDHATAAHGTIDIQAGGGLTYSPDGGWAGDDTFSYTITDAFGRTAAATVTITTAVPGAPAAAPDAYSTPYGTDLVVPAAGILGNDAGTSTTVTASGPAAHGTLTAAADGSLSYSPDAGWAGDDTFSYTITDAFGRTSTGQVTVTTGLPSAPSANDDAYSATYENALTVAAAGVLANDAGTGTTVTGHATPGHGSVIVAADGSLTYTPDDGWAGDDTFSYTITDGFGRTASATVTITTSLPAAPFAADDTYSAAYGSDVTVAAPGVLGNDSGTTITVTKHGAAAHGTVTVDPDGSLTYTPDAGWAGDDTFDYTITDAFDRTATATVTVVTGLPGAPVATADAYTTDYATPIDRAAPGVLANDSGTGTTVTSSTPALHGTVDIAADGSLSYTPAAGWSGDDAVTYTITDAFGRTSSTQVTITTNRPAAPVATDDVYSTGSGAALTVVAPGLTANDSGTAISVTDHSAAGHGTLLVAGDGSLSYTPDTAWAGTDSFDYTITDAFGRTATATVTVTTSLPGAPVAATDTYTTPYGTDLTVNAPGVLGNDTGSGVTVTANGIPAHGTVTVDPDGTLTYTPDAGWTGNDGLTYTITDAFGQTSTTQVTITTAPPAAPAAADDTYETAFDTDLTVDAPGVTGNDTGTGLSVVTWTPAGHGTLSIGSYGVLTYTPDTGWQGTDTATYTVTDPFGQTAVATVTIVTLAPGASTTTSTTSTTVAPTTSTTSTTVAPTTSTTSTTVAPTTSTTSTTSTTVSPTTSTTVAPTTSTTSTTVSPTDPRVPDPDPGTTDTDSAQTSGPLVRTGAEVGSLLLLALGLFGTGIALVAIARRRRTISNT